MLDQNATLAQKKPPLHGVEPQAGIDPDYLNRLMPEQAAAEFLGVEIKTLQAWRVKGGGPTYVRLSRRAVRYQRRAMLTWIEGKCHTSTSEYVL